MGRKPVATSRQDNAAPKLPRVGGASRVEVTVGCDGKYRGGFSSTDAKFDLSVPPAFP